MTRQDPIETARASGPSLLRGLLYPYGLWALFALPGAAMTVAIFTADDTGAGRRGNLLIAV